MKLLALFFVSVLLSVAYSNKAQAIGSNPIVVRKIEPKDSKMSEEWERVTDDEDILGVSASKTGHLKWNWGVFISAAEFVREDPLESLLVHRVTSALKKVEGVKAVFHEDREVWVIEGDANGEALVRAASSAIDSLAPRIRKHMNYLKERAEQ